MQLASDGRLSPARRPCVPVSGLGGALHDDTVLPRTNLDLGGMDGGLDWTGLLADGLRGM